MVKHFVSIFERCLQPQLIPYDGTNPRRVVILDNASIHHVQPAIDLIQETGAFSSFSTSLFTSFYANRGVLFRGYLRGYDLKLEESEMEQLILTTYTSITADD